MDSDQKEDVPPQKQEEDFEFDLVFEKPHLTPDRSEAQEKKAQLIKTRRKKPLPKIKSHEEFMSMLSSDKSNKKGGKKTRKRKRNKKRKTQKRKYKKRRT